MISPCFLNIYKVMTIYKVMIIFRQAHVRQKDQCLKDSFREQ